MDRGKQVKWEAYIGKRCVVIQDFPGTIVSEVVVKEVSPSKRLVKFHWVAGGGDSWEEVKDWLLIECLD